MSSEEVKIERSKTRKRNMVAKMLRDTGDYKGAFSLKIINPKKGEYKRKRLRVNDYEEND